MVTKILLALLLAPSIAWSGYFESNYIFDSSGNSLSSTSGALNSFITNSTIGVTGTFWQTTQPVSGTFWQTTQPVSISGSVPVTGSFWQTTQPVSASALPLPTNAVQETGGNLATVVTNTGRIPAQGNAAQASSLPVNMANAFSLVTTVFTSSTGVINTDMLSGSINGWYDAAAYNQLSTDIYTGTTVTGGVITFEQTDDVTSAAVGISLDLQDQTVLTQTNVTSLTLAASTVKHYQTSLLKRYVRFRLSTAFAGTGTVGATVVFRQGPYAPLTMPVNQATAGSLNTTVGSGTITTVSTVTASNSAIPGIVADVASAAITTTTTTATLTPTAGQSYSVSIPVTVVSGTTPTFAVQVQESLDTGTTWQTVYTFPTITTTGFYISPPITFQGNRIRYVQTLTGTTPSFTRAINRLQGSGSTFIQPAQAAFVDRSGTITTGGTSQQLSPANPGRRYFSVENLSSTATLYINFTSAATAASGSIAILPYGTWTMESSSITNEQINIISATTSAPFTAKEM